MSLSRKAMTGICIIMAVFYMLSIAFYFGVYYAEKSILEGYVVTGMIHFVAVVLWLMIFSAIAYTFYSMRRTRIRRTKEIFYDELLDIPNRKALLVVYDKLPEYLLDQMYMVIFDVDKFKEFNYIYGSETGDRLLKYIAQVLYEVEPEVYLFRYMSDYFVVLDKSSDPEMYEKKINVVLDRFRKDIEDGVIPPFDISAGVRKVRSGESLQIALSDALVARETVKGNHLRSYAFYDANIRNRRLAYMEIESSFSSALKNKEFKVYYQPKVDMKTGKIVGAEALARWIRSDGRFVSPGEFIPCLENSRQVMMLDEEILSEVCRQMKQMEAEGLEVKRVSVNLSRVHLRNPGILPKIENIIKRYDMDPSKLSFEITETALYEDSIPLKMIVDHLHALGCKVEMDDYGVGVSGPNSLAKNNFDVVKLDKSLADGLGNERVEDVIRSTAHMARKWGMAVLVEGVESMKQAERLVELGCSYAQGFYYFRPVPESDYRALLRAEAEGALDTPKVPIDPRYFPDEVCAVLDGDLTPTIIVDPEHFVLIYCNQALRKRFREDPSGGLCYKKIRGRNKPCEDCPAIKLYRNRDNSPMEVRTLKGGWNLIQTSPLRWQGRDLVQITFTDISKQKQMEEELLLRSKEYEVIIKQSLTGVMRYNIVTDTATVNVDRNLNRVEEYTITDCIKRAQGSGMIEAGCLTVAKGMMEDIRSGLPSKGYNLQIIPAQGGSRWYHFDYTVIDDEQGNPYRAVISFFDRTVQFEKERTYQNWNAGLTALMDEMTIYIGVNLSQGVVESENRFGFWAQDSIGQDFASFIREIADKWLIPEYLDEFENFFQRERLLGMYYAGQREDSLEYLAMNEGEPQWFRVSLQMADDPASNDVKASLVFHHVDSEVRERERLTKEAERDSLTGLYNRATTERLISEVLGQHSGEHCCFLVIDLDDLRDINSSLGHPEGDRALKGIADAMRSRFRKGDILGRIGGDEFVAFLRNVPEADKLKSSIFDFLCRVREVGIGPDNNRFIHVSVGGAIGVAGKDKFKTIYEQADLALYYTKAKGKNAFYFYVPEMENREFFYQPYSASESARTDWYETVEIRRLVKAMSAFFPLVFSVNLTKNTYCMMSYVPYIAEQADDEGVFDDLVQIGANAFHPDDRKGFLDCCCRENLLKSYAEGKRVIGYKGRQLGADGIYRVVQTVVLFVEERESGDICQITFAHIMPKE